MDRNEHGGSGGFTILEAAIGSMILLTVMSSLTMMTVGSFYLNGASRQSQSASFLANQAIEEVRALPFQTVTNGLSDSDPTIATDPEIRVSGTAPNQTLTFVPTGEVIPHGNLSYSQVPLTPHQTTQTIDSTNFTVSVYPTFATSMSGVYRVTAIVSWTDPLHGNMQREQSAQTLVYSPGANSGSCLSPDTHPFAAPCSSAFYATVTSGAGSVTVAPVPGSGLPAIAGINLTQAQLLLAQADSTAQIEQTVEVLGSAHTSGGVIEVNGQPELTTGADTAASSADNDPAHTATAPNSSTVSQNAQPISASDGNVLSITPTYSDTASTTSVTAAGAGAACDDLGGATQSNGLPCGSASVHQSAGMAMSASINAGNISLGSTLLASVGPPPSSTSTFLTRSEGPPSTYCPAATGQGCIHAGGTRSVGDIAIAAIPPGLLDDAPAGWAGASCGATNALLQLDGFSDTVTSESGSGSSNPTASQNAGALVYWNGSGCSTMNVDWQSGLPAIAVPPVSISVPGIDNGISVTMDTTLSFGYTGTTVTNPAGCTTPCTSDATSSSPVVATVVYSITDGTVALADLEIVLNLGTLSASTSWQAA